MSGLCFNGLADDQVDNVKSSLLLDSDEDNQTTLRKHGGSRRGKAPNIQRGLQAATKLYNDSFADVPVYNRKHFSRRSRISMTVFTRIVDAIEVHDPYFTHIVLYTQQRDCTGQLGFTSLQTATAAIRLITYGAAADSLEEYLRMGESTLLDCLENFCESVIACFGDEYLRHPTYDELRGILARAEERGFPSMMGSIDCSKYGRTVQLHYGLSIRGKRDYRL